MPPVISSVLTCKKPLDAHEWLGDTDARDEFYLELKNYLISAIAQQIDESSGYVKHHLESYWLKKSDQFEENSTWQFVDDGERTVAQQEQTDEYSLLRAIDDTVIAIEGVHFSALDWADPQHDYPQLFSLIKALSFIVCDFKAKVLISGRISGAFVSDHHSCDFKDCSLNQVVIKSSHIDIRLFEFSKDKDAVLKALKIKKSTFNVKLSLSYIKTIESLELSSTIFNKKFALTNCECNKPLIKNTNFKGLAEFYSSQFTQFQLRKSIFSDFVGFEKCQFGIKQAEKKEAVTLNYVTFYSFINFRNAVFNQPLDLRNTNRKEQPNFLDAYFSGIAAESTDRETFRIIKHSFYAVGNHIEANRYFAREMQAYRRELKKEASEGSRRHWRERFLLGVNALASKHGQNYLCASAWFFAVIGIIALVLANDEYKYCIASAPIQHGLYFFGDALNGFALVFLPLGAVFEGKEYLAFFLFFATLVCQGLQSICW